MSLQDENRALLLALTKLVRELSEETANLMESTAGSLQASYVAEQREKARLLRAKGQRVLRRFESVLGKESL